MWSTQANSTSIYLLNLVIIFTRHETSDAAIQDNFLSLNKTSQIWTLLIISQAIMPLSSGMQAFNQTSSWLSIFKYLGIFFKPVVKPLIALNWLCWKQYLHHGNWKTLQIRTWQKGEGEPVYQHTIALKSPNYVPKSIHILDLRWSRIKIFFGCSVCTF